MGPASPRGLLLKGRYACASQECRGRETAGPWIFHCENGLEGTPELTGFDTGRRDGVLALSYGGALRQRGHIYHEPCGSKSDRAGTYSPDPAALRRGYHEALRRGRAYVQGLFNAARDQSSEALLGLEHLLRIRSVGPEQERLICNHTARRAAAPEERRIHSPRHRWRRTRRRTFCDLGGCPGFDDRPRRVQAAWEFAHQSRAWACRGPGCGNRRLQCPRPARRCALQ